VAGKWRCNSKQESHGGEAGQVCFHETIPEMLKFSQAWRKEILDRQCRANKRPASLVAKSARRKRGRRSIVAS
jgi:hypothetical protein